MLLPILILFFLLCRTNIIVSYVILYSFFDIPQQIQKNQGWSKLTIKLTTNKLLIANITYLTKIKYQLI